MEDLEERILLKVKSKKLSEEETASILSILSWQEQAREMAKDKDMMEVAFPGVIIRWELDRLRAAEEGCFLLMVTALIIFIFSYNFPSPLQALSTSLLASTFLAFILFTYEWRAKLHIWREYVKLFALRFEVDLNEWYGKFFGFSEGAPALIKELMKHGITTKTTEKGLEIFKNNENVALAQWTLLPKSMIPDEGIENKESNQKEY